MERENKSTKMDLDLGLSMNTGKIFNDDTPITREEKMILRDQGRNPELKVGHDSSVAAIANHRIMANNQ